MSLNGKKWVSIAVDGEEWRVRLDLSALALFEELRGKSVGAVFADLQSPQGDGVEVMRKLSALDLRALVYVSLHRYHPELTLDQAGELIHVGNAGEVLGELQRAFLPFLPKVPEEGGGGGVPLP